MMGLSDKLKNLKEKMMKYESVKNDVLVGKYGKNIYDIELTDTIKTGVADKLMQARELGIPFCVIFGHVVPGGKWDPYENGTWNPPRDYITTEDIATEDNDRDKERQNIYAFLRGEEIIKNAQMHK
jgi:hypothetical protein